MTQIEHLLFDISEYLGVEVHVIGMGMLVLTVLLLSSTLMAFLHWNAEQQTYKKLSSRVNAWWAMAGIFFGALLVDPVITLVFFAFLSFWGLKEYVTLLNTRRSDHRALFWMFLAIPVQYYWIYDGWYGLFVIFIPVYVFLLLPARLVLSRETDGFVNSVSKLHWGLMAFVFGLSHMAFLIQLPISSGGNSAVTGKSLLLFLVFVTEMSDVLQYVWGKLVGTHAIIPDVSPNKTWEGFLGGVFTAGALSVGLRFLTPFTLLETAGVAIGIGVLGFMGDLVMSAIKRDFGIDDFGATIPGHGGMLDRLDSLCYSAPIFFHFVRYFYT